MTDAEDLIPADTTDPCDAQLDGDYDLTMHIAAIFIIMATSLIGTLLPLICKHLLATHIGQNTLMSLKLFGAGVILATAFVHMFVPATLALTDTCLPEEVKRYPSLSAAFAIFGILSTHLAQLLAAEVIQSSRNPRFSFTQEEVILDGTAIKGDLHPDGIQNGQAGDQHRDNNSDNSVISVDVGNNLPRSNQDIIEKSAHSDQAIPDTSHERHTHTHSGVLAYTNNAQLSVYLLELGIASHSVIIGITLGIAADEFNSLFIALVFHQFFEGMALSAIVSEANFKNTSMSIGIVIFYTFTTPIGIAIGILSRSVFHDSATQMLLVTGCLDAISAGILGYDGLVNVIAPHFQSLAFSRSSHQSKCAQLLCLYFGTAIMSLIGYWA